MARKSRKSNLKYKIGFIVVSISILVGIVSFINLYTNYIADKNLRDSISQNPERTNNFDYSGTTVEDASGEYKVNYSRLGTGFSYKFPIYSNMEVNSSNPDDIPNLLFKNVMPYTDSVINFGYVNSDAEFPGNEVGLKIISQKAISVDGKSAQIFEAERDNYSEGFGGSYTYHVYVIVDNVMQAERFSSNKTRVTPKKFVIRASTGNTTDKRAKEEIIKRVNELIPTIKFIEN